MPFADAIAPGLQPYKYNGKELDTRNGLNQYDNLARLYDPVFPHTPAPDPHAENYYAWSPYAWVMNNPMKYVDPMEMDTTYFQSTFTAPVPGTAFTQLQGELATEKPPYKYIGTYTEGDGGDNVAMVDLATVDVSPNYVYGTGGVSRDYYGNIIGERPLESVHPEFEVLTLGRGIANSLARRMVTGSATKGGSTIVGEGMKRVSVEAAKHPNSVILNDMPAFTGAPHQVTSQMMTYNRQWLLLQMRSGRPVIDIGLDPMRTNPSIFYQMEQNMMKNYLKLHPNAFQIIRP